MAIKSGNGKERRKRTDAKEKKEGKLESDVNKHSIGEIMTKLSKPGWIVGGDRDRRVGRFFRNSKEILIEFVYQGGLNISGLNRSGSAGGRCVNRKRRIFKSGPV